MARRTNLVPITVFVDPLVRDRLKDVAALYERSAHYLMSNAAYCIAWRMLDTSIKMRPSVNAARVAALAKEGYILPDGSMDWDAYEADLKKPRTDLPAPVAAAPKPKKVVRRVDPSLKIDAELDESGKVWQLNVFDGPTKGQRTGSLWNNPSPALIRHLKRQQGWELTEEEHEAAIENEEEVRNDDGSYRVLGISERPGE